MGNITTFLREIISARYGKDVRKNIHDAIEQCYNDAIEHGHSDMEVSQARGTFQNLGARLDDNDEKVEDLEELTEIIDLLNIPNTRIVAESDLNDFTSPGTFYSTEGSITNTLLNKPESLTVAFKMIVGYINLSTRVLQIIISNDSTPKIFVRKGHGEDWGEWKKLAYDNLITSSFTFKNQNNNVTCTCNVVKYNNVISMYFSLTVPANTTLAFSKSSIVSQEFRPPFSAFAKSTDPNNVLAINSNGDIVGAVSNDLEDESKNVQLQCTFVKG